MKKLSFLFLLFLSAAAWGNAEVGSVVDKVGEAFVTVAGGQPTPAQFRQPIHLGDAVTTGKMGAVKILFSDDTLLTVKENSKTLITEYLFNPSGKQRKVVFNVLFGKIRTVVSRFFGKDQPVEIKTPNAIAGIRGTDVGAFVKNKSTTFYCFDGTFESYNIDLPEKPILVTTGNFTEIIGKQIPTPLMAIPATIQDNKIEIFDIPLSPKTESKSESGGSTTTSSGTGTSTNTTTATTTPTSPTSAAQTQTASAQVAEQSQKASTQEAMIQTVQAAAAIVETTTQNTAQSQTSLLNAVTTANAIEATSTSITPGVTDTSTQILPGAAASSSTLNQSTITITLPTP